MLFNSCFCMNVEYQQVCSFSLSQMLRVCKIKKLDLTAFWFWIVVACFYFVLRTKRHVSFAEEVLGDLLLKKSLLLTGSVRSIHSFHWSMGFSFFNQNFRKPGSNSSSICITTCHWIWSTWTSRARHNRAGLR